MKTKTHHHCSLRNARRFAAVLLAAGITCVAVFAADNNSGDKKSSSGFVDRMKQWQSEMTNTFRETFEKLRDDSKNSRSTSTAAADLREQTDSYTLRLNLPDRDLEKVDIKLENDTLHIVAPAEGKAGRYQQSITLAGVKPDAKLAIERKQKDRLIVVTVPKSSGPAESAGGAKHPKEPALGEPPLLPLRDDWDRDVFERMERMQRRMDRVFEDAFKEFRLTPEHRGFFDLPRFGSSVDLKDEGDNYTIRAYLPGRDMNNVKVSVEDRTLKIEAKAEETNKKDDANGPVVSRMAHYGQILTLPGPVQSDKMKIDRKDGMLVITLPKSK